jgi:hypothetical protein
MYYFSYRFSICEVALTEMIPLRLASLIDPMTRVLKTLPFLSHRSTHRSERCPGSKAYEIGDIPSA